MRHRMRRLQCGHDALHTRQSMKSCQSLIIVSRDILNPADILQPGVLRPYAGVIESGRHRVGLKDLSVFILHQIGAVTVQNARTADRQRGCVLTGLQALATRLNAVHRYALILQKGVKQSDCIGAATHAGHQRIRQLTALRQALRTRLTPNDALKVPYEHGIRMRTCDRANDVEGILHVRDPVTHGFVHGVFQSP